MSTPFDNPSLVPCPMCGGDRGWDVPHAVDYRDGSLITHWQECTHCDTTGSIEAEMITMDDLDLMAGEDA